MLLLSIQVIGDRHSTKRLVVLTARNTAKAKRWIYSFGKTAKCKGQAVDIECPGTANYDVAKWIEENVDFDQLILEFYTPGIPDSGWVHVSYNSAGNRKSILTAMKENGKTVYKPGLIQ